MPLYQRNTDVARHFILIFLACVRRVFISLPNLIYPNKTLSLVHRGSFAPSLHTHYEAPWRHGVAKIASAKAAKKRSHWYLSANIFENNIDEIQLAQYAKDCLLPPARCRYPLTSFWPSGLPYTARTLAVV